MSKEQKRGAFKSNFGVMMAVAGSAVGLGNIWRFPYMVGENGGAAFLLLYLVLILLIGLPLILSEFAIGRAAGRGAVGAFKILAPGTRWYGIGYMAIVAGFTILGFYSVIAGWTLRFLGEALSDNFTGQSGAEIARSFSEFVNSGWKPVLLSGAFIAIAASIVIRGVEKGIEKSNKVLMPVLLVILVLLCFNSMTLSGFSDGLEFLFKPDFSKITMKTVLDALGQVFFTLSIGMGVMITYSSYVTKDDNMARSKGIITIIDTSIAILAGIAIFPAVFTFGIEPAQGPDLVFLTLPNIFAQMPGGFIVGILFFVLLAIAAVTSAVSILEMMTAYFIEEYRMRRVKAVVIISIGVFVLAVLSALSQVEGSQMRIFGRNIFDTLDMLSSNYLMTLGGLLTAIFTGWVFERRKLRLAFTSGGKYAVWLFPVFLFFVRYVCPLAVAVIFLTKIGLVG